MKPDKNKEKKPLPPSFVPFEFKSNAFIPFILSPVLPAVLYMLANVWRRENSILTNLTYLVPASLLAIFISWALMLVLAMPLYFILKVNGVLRPLYIIPLAGLITITPLLF